MPQTLFSSVCALNNKVSKILHDRDVKQCFIIVIQVITYKTTPMKLIFQIGFPPDACIKTPHLQTKPAAYLVLLTPRHAISGATTLFN
mgnify:CR=1 FL=1